MTSQEGLQHRTEVIDVESGDIQALLKYKREMKAQLDEAATTPTVTNEGAQAYLEAAQEEGNRTAILFEQVADRLSRGTPVSIAGQDHPERKGERLYRVTTGFHVEESIGQRELDLLLGALFQTPQVNRVGLGQRDQNTTKKEKFRQALREDRIVALQPPPARPRRS